MKTTNSRCQSRGGALFSKGKVDHSNHNQRIIFMSTFTNLKSVFKEISTCQILQCSFLLNEVACPWLYTRTVQWTRSDLTYSCAELSGRRKFPSNARLFTSVLNGYLRYFPVCLLLCMSCHHCHHFQTLHTLRSLHTDVTCVLAASCLRPPLNTIQWSDMTGLRTGRWRETLVDAMMSSNYDSTVDAAV